VADHSCSDDAAHSAESSLRQARDEHERIQRRTHASECIGLLTEAEREVFRRAFAEADISGSGRLTADKFGHLVLHRVLGSKVSKLELESLMTDFGLDRDAKMDFNECRALFAKLLRPCTDSELMEALRAHDVDGDGCLHRDELARIFALFGDDQSPISLTDMGSIFELMDSENSGAVPFEDVCAFLVPGGALQRQGQRFADRGSAVCIGGPEETEEQRGATTRSKDAPLSNTSKG
jgi:Ca2+-binding EF-hand superfamily protein